MYGEDISRVIKGQEIINRKRYEIDQLISIINGFLKLKGYRADSFQFIPLAGPGAEMTKRWSCFLGDQKGKLTLFKKKLGDQYISSMYEPTTAQHISLNEVVEVHTRLEDAVHYFIAPSEYKELSEFLQYFIYQTDSAQV